MLGIKLARTSPHRPQSNGLVERLHRPLKQALMCYKSDWFEALPLVLLGLRSTLREDLGASAAQLTYGSTLRLPGQLYEEKTLSNMPDYVARLQRLISSLSPSTPVRHGQQQIYIPKDLQNCTHVFVRLDAVKKSLQPPYEGPYEVLKRMDKNFLISVNDKEKIVHIDRLKPAFLIAGDSNPRTPGVITRFGRKVRFRLPMVL
ncbi:uncharacterized protein LOC129223004 [Uloborus diversus]|uniref:uncharacterized protein LOC129223004 n=1 Tax=Uloborus diversus TaxID=327109 RepID=UPI00240A3ACD|nr:uncharacterized protein LOC129223004 [Uloborus diversus]